MDRGIALVNAPDNIAKMFRDIIKSHWHLPLISLTQIEGIIPYHVFDIMGSPWSSSKPDAFHTHALFCHMLRKFGEKGYKFVMSADVHGDNVDFDGGKRMKHDPNSWWFMKEPDSYLDFGDAAKSLTTAASETNSTSCVPPIGLVLKDDLKEPPCPDFAAHEAAFSPSAPLVYEPPKAMCLDGAGSDDAAGFSGGYRSESIGFEALEVHDGTRKPPPSYEEVMRGETLP